MVPNGKTWIELSRKALRSNIAQIRKRIGPRVKLWAVVKSNAYGHGLLDFSRLADPVRGREDSQRVPLETKYLTGRASASNGAGVDGFCVDSVVEGAKLRGEGIKKPILVLGPTFRPFLKDAVQKNITITISNFDALAEYLRSRVRPAFHLKIDTGMHRQGFCPDDLTRLIGKVKSSKLKVESLLTGIYTHFASAKDINRPTFTELQFAHFMRATAALKRAGVAKLIRHAAGTGGMLLNVRYHMDAVRVGIGLYGLWPSKELALQIKNFKPHPVLSWHSAVSEIKQLDAGEYVSYDLTERLTKPTKVAIVPVGYWQGYSWRLSRIGEVIIRGARCRVLGRVTMDLIMVDVTKISARRGDRVTLIGGTVTPYELAEKVGTSHYEIITRLNPLILKVPR